MIRIAALLALAMPGVASAADNVVPGCYARTGVGMAAPAPTRALFVMIDQTTPMPGELDTMLRAEAARMVSPGTTFAVASFSATQGGNFARVTTTGTTEAPVPTATRNNLPVPGLRNLDACLAAQGGFARRKLDEAIRRAAPPTDARFERSEIMRTLRDLSARVAATPARERIVILYSDMLEHSDTASFFEKRQLRTIDPRAELAAASVRGLRGNFAGARVYVIGGALAADGGFRDSRARDNLRAFWAAWFRQSNARLVEFGMPGLVNPVR